MILLNVKQNVMNLNHFVNFTMNKTMFTTHGNYF